MIQPIQVTVVADTGETSDALATAGCVLGVEGLRRIMERHYPGAGAIVRTREDGRWIVTRIGKIPVRDDGAP